MLLSFDVLGVVLVRLQIHQVLPLCPSTTSIADLDRSAVSFSPNPSNGEAIRVQTNTPIESIDVVDPTGKVLATYNGSVRSIPAPATPGTYLVRITDDLGRRTVSRFLRY